MGSGIFVAIAKFKQNWKIMKKPQPFTMKLTSYVEQMPPSVKQMAENKRLVQAYLRGEMSKDELESKGVKLARPL